MKNKLWLLFYILILMLIIFFEFNKSQNSLQSSSNRNYNIEENRGLTLYMEELSQPLESNISSNKLWKILPKKIKKVEIIKRQDVDVTVKDKTICIEKNCFKLLGIFLDKEYYLTFYNKDKKIKMETFKKDDTLDLNIKIKNIEKNNVVFLDINSTREWNIKLFDVNSSKYKPKEFE